MLGLGFRLLLRWESYAYAEREKKKINIRSLFLFACNQFSFLRSTLIFAFAASRCAHANVGAFVSSGRLRGGSVGNVRRTRFDGSSAIH